MSYAEFEQDAAYNAKMDGAAFQVILRDADNPAVVFLGAVSNQSFSDNYSTTAVEECGDDGVNEIVQGRHTGTGSLSGFWTGERGDALPTRQSFLGKKYTMTYVIAPGRPGAGNVTDAFTGVTLVSNDSGVQARGARTFNLSIQYLRRYSGAEWAALSGT
jgi:hypothetical protein